VKVLIIRLSSIGDVVHTLPVLAALNAQSHEVGWIVEPAAHPLLEGHPMLRQIVPAPRARAWAAGGAIAAARLLREREYDVALDLQGLWKSAAWGRISGARRLLGYGRAGRREPLSSLLVREPVNVAAEASHVIDKNLALLRPLGIEAVGLREFPLPRSEERAQAMRTAVSSFGLKDFIILNAGGGWESKLWPPEGFGAVAKTLHERGVRSLVTWGPGEERLADRVVAASQGAALKCFPTTLVEMAELVRIARLMVAADTGPLHIACAVGTPVVGIYGPTDPARNGPFSPRDVTVRRTPLCSPCHRRRCSIHEGVMQALMPQEVIAAIERRLAIAPVSKALAV
jgi:lipopolysaccharide heptosyltransferase I